MSQPIKVILRADNNNLLARCNHCIPSGAFPDSGAVHVPYKEFLKSDGMPWAVFTMHKLDNGKYAFEADSGNYIARCNNCVPRAAYSDNIMVHVSSAELSNAPWAQFTLKRLKNGKYALQTDSGKYVARCNNCIPGGAKADMAFVHVTERELGDAPWAQWDLIVLP